MKMKNFFLLLHREFQDVISFVGHENHLVMIQCFGQDIVSSSADGTLRIWDAQGQQQKCFRDGDSDEKHWRMYSNLIQILWDMENRMGIYRPYLYSMEY